jgi:hypothetical protein
MVEVKLDLNPHREGGEWHVFDIHTSPYDTGKEKGIELFGYKGENLDLYGILPLETAKLLRDELDKDIKVLEQKKESGKYTTNHEGTSG